MKTAMVELVGQALAGKVPVLVLRGNDSFARVGGDIDFMVAPGQSRLACQIVAQLAHERGWFVAGVRDIGYLAQLALVRVSAEGRDDSLKLDFFDGLRWYGIGRDEAARRLFDLLERGVVPATVLSGVACFFQKALIVGRLSGRDMQRVKAFGIDAETITRIGASVGLPITTEHAVAGGVAGWRKWRLRAASCGAYTSAGMLPWFVAAVWAHLRFKLGIGTRAGMVVGISGIDGSGKSTVNDRLLAAFRTAGGVQPKQVHLLPTWIPLPHQLIRRKRTMATYERPYAEPPVRCGVGASARLAFYVLAFTVTRVALAVSGWRGRVVVMDRSAVDFLADPTRSRIPMHEAPAWLVRWLVPRARLFWLDVSPGVAVTRKGELALDKAATLRRAYQRIAKLSSIRRVDADACPDSVFTAILADIDAECMRRLQSAVDA